MSAKRSLVFVYGTLKRGEPNHEWLTRPTNGSAAFVGMATTEEAFPLVIASRYNIPFLLDAPGQGERVSGELYEVDGAMLTKLDELEVHPKIYLRQEKQVRQVTTAGEQVKTAHLYLLRGYFASLLRLPRLRCYSAAGEHDTPFVPRSSRDPSGPSFAVDVLQTWPSESS